MTKFSRLMANFDDVVISPRQFFEVLIENDELVDEYPEIYQLQTALEKRKWHPEGDAYEHTMLVLEQAYLREADSYTMLACLLHDIGKAYTPRKHLPEHYGHDVNGAKLIPDILRGWGCVDETLIKEVALCARYHMYFHKLHELNPKTVIRMFDELAEVSDRVVGMLYDVGVADRRGRLHHEFDDISDMFLYWDYYEIYTNEKDFMKPPRQQFTDMMIKIKEAKNAFTKV